MMSTKDEFASRQFVVSIVPSIIGWAALLVPPVHGLPMLAIAVAMIGGADLALSRQSEAPEWFGRLRMLLTWVVVISLALAIYAQYVAE